MGVYIEIQDRVTEEKLFNLSDENSYSDVQLLVRAEALRSDCC